MALEKMTTGDILVFVDAGCTVNTNGLSRFQHYLNLLSASQYDIVSFQNEHIEHKWTTQHIFDALNVSRNETIRNSGQYLGGILILRKGEHLQHFL